MRHLKCFKLKFKDEFDAKYKKEKETKEIPEEKNSPDTSQFNFWNMIEAGDFRARLDGYINSKDKANHLLKKLFSFDYFSELTIKQSCLLDRIQVSEQFQQKSEEDQIKFFKYIGDFFDGALANDAKKILQEKYAIKSKVIEKKQNELLNEKNIVYEAKNKNVPSRKKFWIGILLLIVIIIALGVLKPWIFVFLVVPIVLSILCYVKKQNETGSEDLNIKNKPLIKEDGLINYNLLKNENKDKIGGCFIESQNENQKNE